jgi:hypothetical protein
VLKSLLGLSPEEASFARRGFRVGDPSARARLEHVGRTFIEGYNAALLESDPARLADRVGAVEAEARGFAYEGAAMALALLDGLTPWRRGRFRALLGGPAASHAYMLHVGFGWALARLPGRPRRALRRLDPLLRWLALDGYGFHQGYFHWNTFINAKAEPQGLSGYARRAFDQGLGRSLWFVEGADVGRVAARVGTFRAARRGDLWAGAGLACAYAGGVDRLGLEALRTACPGPDRPKLAQGAAFAAKARQRAGNPAPHTALACDVLCGLTADEAAGVTDDALNGLPRDGDDDGRGPGDGGPAYEAWRARIQARFSRQFAVS